MKKVGLIDPAFNPGNIPPNLGLGQIEAALAGQPIDIQVTDFVVPNSAKLSLAAFRELELEFVKRVVEDANGADAIYISGSHGMEMKPYAMFPRIKAISVAIKAAHPNTKIVFGGALANFYISVHKLDPALFKAFGIDQVVEGQELNAASVILATCAANTGLTQLTVKGATRAHPAKKGMVPQWNAWDLTQYPHYLSAMIQTGCPYQCSFCFEGKVYNPQNPQTPPESVMALVAGVRQRHPVDAVMIEDSIALSYRWFDVLMATMQGTGINWAIYARSNEIVKHQDKLKALRKAGCRSMIVGIESFEDEDLQATNKRVTAQQTFRAIELCAQADIAIQGCLILGFPADTLDQIESRVKLARDLGLSTYHWHILQPNWKDLPAGILGMDGAKITDHFDAQVSVPDACLPELVEQAPAMAIYDEHLLIRLLPHYNDVARLKAFGYKDKFTMHDLMGTVTPIIRDIGLPTNEDEMYPILFDPSKGQASQPVNVAAAVLQARSQR
jgi:hypothetical protein